MAHDEQRAIVGSQCALECLDRIQVEIVRGLIEYQQGRHAFAAQHAGERSA